MEKSRGSRVAKLRLPELRNALSVFRQLFWIGSCAFRLTSFDGEDEMVRRDCPVVELYCAHLDLKQQRWYEPNY
jgi:hypothetical protein